MIGLSAYVYRWGLGDCTRGGISAKADEVFVVTEAGYEQTPRRPVLFLHRRHNLLGGNKDYPCLCPEPEGQTSKWWQFGGNFAYTSDARFGGAPLPIHDRCEE